jgi:ribosomal protein S18 acetylase RimI-like enzyme
MLTPGRLFAIWRSRGKGDARDMIIREIETGNISALAELARRTFSDAFGTSISASDLAFHLQNNLSDAYFRAAADVDVFLIAEIEARLIGYVQFGAVEIPAPGRSPGDQELRRLYVQSGFQGRGIGQQLLDAALHHPHLKVTPNVFLDVWEQNDGARRLYERYGFAVVGAHAFAVASGATSTRDLIMVRRQRP